MSRAGRRSTGQLRLDRPAWRWEYENPVIETVKNNHRSTVHAVDPDADEPTPACGGCGNHDTDWTAKELVGGLAAFRRPCTHPHCMQPLARKARQLGVRFDA